MCIYVYTDIYIHFKLWPNESEFDNFIMQFIIFSTSDLTKIKYIIAAAFKQDDHDYVYLIKR